jgi:hypothetical protein
VSKYVSYFTIGALNLKTHHLRRQAAMIRAKPAWPRALSAGANWQTAKGARRMPLTACCVGVPLFLSLSVYWHGCDTPSSIASTLDPARAPPCDKSAGRCRIEEKTETAPFSTPRISDGSASSAICCRPAIRVTPKVAGRSRRSYGQPHANGKAVFVGGDHFCRDAGHQNSL